MYNHQIVCKQMTDIKLFIFDENILNRLTVCKQISTGSLKNVIYKLNIYKYIFWQHFFVDPLSSIKYV